MPTAQPSEIKAKTTQTWVSPLLVVLAISTYTIIYFALENSVTGHSEHAKEQYFYSLVFFLIMALVIFITLRDRRITEKNLHAAQQDYFDLIQQAADPVVVLSETGIVISANSAVEAISGYTPGEIVGHHFLKINILSGDGLAVAAREFIKAVRGSKSPPFDLKMLRKDGTPFFTEAHARRVINTDGKIAVHVILRDITQRKKSEEILLKQKNLAQTYLNIAGVMIVALDAAGKVTLINKKGLEILGYSEEQIIGQNWFDKFLTHEESLTSKEIFARLMAGEKNLHRTLEKNVVTKSGEKRLLSWNHTLICDQQNKIIGALSSGHDITEKQKFEDQLKLQSAALDAAANVIVITDKTGKILWANQALSDVSGYSREEAIGQNPKILKSGLHNESYYSQMWNTILNGNIWHGEIINRRKDARFYTEEMTITPIRNQAGQIENFIAIKRDITDRKRLEQDLKQANIELANNSHKLERSLIEITNKNVQLQEAQNQLIQSEKLAAIGVLSSGIAHEIKNPLAIISLSIEEFEAISEKLDDQSKVFIQMIKNAADRANNVIIELLRFARVSDLKATNINLYDLIEGTFVLAQNSSRLKGINLTHQNSNKNITLLGDRILLEQVLFNLLMNAIDSTERQGLITVRTFLKDPANQEDKKVIIEIHDNGCGIPAEILPRIFEPFFTTKEQGQGTGLGLSTVYTLLKRHQGTIDVESTVGVGTKFIITLPCTLEIT